MNAFVTPIMWTINVGFLFKKFRQCLIKKKDKINYNQKELNEIFELESMKVSTKYSYIEKTLLLSFLYAPLFPLGLGISLLGFIIGYWLEKYNFSKMYKKPEMLDKIIAEYHTKFFVLIFWAYGVGDLCFLSHEKNYSSIINFFLFHFLIVSPFQSYFYKDFLKFKQSEIYQKKYDDIYVDFFTDYERANPMTNIEGEIRYIDKLEEMHKINKEERDVRKKKIKQINPMKSYLIQQRLSRIQNIQGLNNLLNMNHKS